MFGFSPKTYITVETRGRSVSLLLCVVNAILMMLMMLVCCLCGFVEQILPQLRTVVDVEVALGDFDWLVS